MVAEFPAESRMALAPVLEAAGDPVEELASLRRRFEQSGLLEETSAKPRVPADVVPAPHLIFEETRQKHALGAGGFHEHAVAPQRGVDDETIEDRAECRWRW